MAGAAVVRLGCDQFHLSLNPDTASQYLDLAVPAEGAKTDHSCSMSDSSGIAAAKTTCRRASDGCCARTLKSPFPPSPSPLYIQ